MSPIKNLRTSLVYALLCSLCLSGIFTITIGESHASNNSLTRSLTPTVKESAAETGPQAKTADEATRSRVTEAIGHLPLSFEENRGQVDGEVKYLSRGAGYTLFLTATEAVLALRKVDGGLRNERRSRGSYNPQSAFRNPKSAVLRMKLSGANPTPVVRGESEMGVKSNYFIGNDPQKWQTDVARYERVRYSQVYPGVDMIYYGEQQQLEYDFEVAPGADSRQIALEYKGVHRVKVERGTGDLVLQTAGGEVRQHKPVAYQEVGGVRREVASRYVMQGKRKVEIEVGEYDRTKRLVIDPVLSYSTFLGGDGAEYSYGIAVDSAGHAYVTGFTSAYNFPTSNEPQEYPGDYPNAFITKLDTHVSGPAALLYSSYLGGLGYDESRGIAVDSAGNAYVTGITESTDFPVKNQYQMSQGHSDAFVMKLNTNASGPASLLYSTYLGGSDGDFGYAIAIDASGHAYVTGDTYSSDFPTKNQYQADQGDKDAFVTKLDTNAAGPASLLYSTYLGGGDVDGGLSIAVDASSNAYVTGATYSTNFPARHPYPTNHGSYYNSDLFITKLNPNSSGIASLLYSTPLGGDNDDVGRGIAVDSAGNAYVTGTTISTNFPTLHAFQSDNAGHSDAFVTKLNPNLSGTAALLYSTYLGGSFGDDGNAIAVDTAGHAYVTGSADSSDFLIGNYYQSYRGGVDAFVTKLDPGASSYDSLLYSTYLGGNRDDYGFSIAVDSAGSAYVTGFTGSTNFPLRNQYQTYLGGGYNRDDAFITKLTDSYSISGKVTKETADGTGLAGVTIALMTGDSYTLRTVTTASDGTYSFTDVPTPGNFKVKPTMTNYTFSPTQLSFYNKLDNQTGQNFVASLKTYTVSGVVKLGATGLSGVTVKLTSPTPAGFLARTATTNSTGAYSFTGVPAVRNYTVTPTRAGYQFTPTSKSILNLSANQTAVSFLVKVYSISGRVTRTGTTTGISAVTVTLTSPTPAGFAARTTQTSSTGYYTFTNLPAGRNYAIKPTKSGFTFSPASRSITNLSGNIGAGSTTNFTGAGP